MVIFNDYLEMDKNAFKDILRSRNAEVRGESKMLGTIDFDHGTSQFSVYMPGGAMAGWFALETINQSKIRLQVWARKELKDCYLYMKVLTWHVIEACKGLETAEEWIKNVDSYVYKGIVIMPINGELAELADKLNKEELAKKNNGHEDSQRETITKGPYAGTLENTRLAMIDWLDRNKSINASCETNGIDDETMKKYIPNILAIIDERKRTEWIKKIRALGKEKWLGKYELDSDI